MLNAVVCPDTDDLLKQVTNEINEFEAKKLSELKTELDSFVKKKKALVEEYRKAFPTLRGEWCRQQALIENLYRSLPCAFPGQDWKAIVAECICRPLKARDCLQQSIDQRKVCYQGKREHARAVAQERFSQAKKRLDAVVATAQEVKSELDKNSALVKRITDSVPGPDQAVALWLFWFCLLKSHVRMMPADLPPECERFTNENGKTLCTAIDCEQCPPNDNPCLPANNAVNTGPSAASSTDRAPWLLPPEEYSNILNCAWQDYRKAKDALALADAAYKAAPDDLASLNQKLKEMSDGLEATITACLKDHQPEDKCCVAGENAKQGATHG